MTCRAQRRPLVTTRSASGLKSAAGTRRVAATVDSRGKGGGLLRIDYDEPGGNDDDRLHRITWDEFFRIFDENDIAFLHDPESDSRFSKFVAKESADR